MGLLITRPQLVLCLPSANTKIIDACLSHFNEFCEVYLINTPKRLSAFLCQVAHESACMTKLEEGLYYKTPEDLLRVFPHDFKDLNDAKAYVRNPEKTANRVYANQNGNGNEASGDGWKYRGRGAFGTTGVDNYIAVGNVLGIDLLAHPELLSETRYAIASACYYWSSHGLNRPADVEDIKTITHKINGGYNGYIDRLKYWLRARKAFQLPDLKITLEQLSKL